MEARLLRGNVYLDAVLMLGASKAAWRQECRENNAVANSKNAIAGKGALVERYQLGHIMDRMSYIWPVKLNFGYCNIDLLLTQISYKYHISVSRRVSL